MEEFLENVENEDKFVHCIACILYLIFLVCVVSSPFLVGTYAGYRCYHDVKYKISHFEEQKIARAELEKDIEMAKSLDSKNRAIKVEVYDFERPLFEKIKNANSHELQRLPREIAVKHGFAAFISMAFVAFLIGGLSWIFVDSVHDIIYYSLPAIFTITVWGCIVIWDA